MGADLRIKITSSQGLTCTGRNQLAPNSVQLLLAFPLPADLLHICWKEPRSEKWLNLSWDSASGKTILRQQLYLKFSSFNRQCWMRISTFVAIAIMMLEIFIFGKVPSEGLVGWSPSLDHKIELALPIYREEANLSYEAAMTWIWLYRHTYHSAAHQLHWDSLCIRYTAKPVGGTHSCSRMETGREDN